MQASTTRTRLRIILTCSGPQPRCNVSHCSLTNDDLHPRCSATRLASLFVTGLVFWALAPSVRGSLFIRATCARQLVRLRSAMNVAVSSGCDAVALTTRAGVTYAPLRDSASAVRRLRLWRSRRSPLPRAKMATVDIVTAIEMRCVVACP